jgi:protein TonB
MFAPLDSLGARGLSPQSVSVAVAVNLTALLLFLYVARLAPAARPPFINSMLNESLTLPPSLLTAPKLEQGGGGNTGLTPPSHGNPPRYAVEQLSPPQVKPIDDAQLAVAPTIDAQLHMAPAANIGVLTSTLPGASVGNTRGHGVGIGTDDGYGPGSIRGTGDNVFAHGANVIAPQVIYAPEPEFSELARKQKLSGNVLVYLVVDANGRPTRIRVLRGLGAGLDEKAIEAVSRYKFKPAMQNGRPVPVEMNVNVDFQIF